MASEEPIIECKNVACGYEEHVVLSDISLAIYPGEIVTLLGGSGSGKSTLLKALVGLLPPISGEVFLFGENLYELEAAEREKLLTKTGVLFQQGALFNSLTAGENLAWPIREQSDLPESMIEALVRMKLSLVGISGFEDRQPADLSGGQRKRVALARATALDPQILFCDEPSAGLDPVTAAGIDQTLLRFRETNGLTIVAVTHELESIKALSDRAIMLGDGSILATGTVTELAESELEDVRRFFAREPKTPKKPEGSLLERWSLE